MDGRLRIRKARLTDLPAAARLTAAVFQQSVAPLFEAEGIQHFLAYASAKAWAARHRDGQPTWLAFKGERLVGLIQVREGPHVSLFFVDPACQRHGVGRALLQTVCDALDADRLTVNASPNAVGAYRRFGFEALGPEDTKSGIRYVPMQRVVHPPRPATAARQPGARRPARRPD